MPREIVTTSDAPGSPLFSQGVKAGPFILLSGIVGIDPATGSLAGTTIQEQTRQAVRNCEKVLNSAGAGLHDVVEVGVLLTDPADFEGEIHPVTAGEGEHPFVPVRLGLVVDRLVCTHGLCAFPRPEVIRGGIEMGTQRDRCDRLDPHAPRLEP